MFQGWWPTVIAIVTLGGFLRWALWPAIVSFRVGLKIGRMEGARKAATGRGEPLPPYEPESMGGGS